MITLETIMTEDFSELSFSNSVESAVELMEKMSLDYMPVKEQGEIRGMVTKGGLAGYPCSRLIHDCVMEPIASACSETLVIDAPRILEEKKVKFLAVVNRTGTPLGIVSRETIITSLCQELESLNAEKEEYITAKKRAEIKLLDYQQQLQALASELSQTEERERRCLAMQLHDSIGQLLASSKMRLTTISQHANLPSNVSQAINETKEQIESAIKHTRTLISELSPPVLYELEFSDAIEWLTERTGAEHGIHVDVEVGSEAISPPENIRVVLFQATRELLANVVKHAQATHAKVTMRRKCDQVEIEVSDNGVGFDGASLGLHRNGSGFGLFNIRERLNLLGGNIQINSKPGGESRITLIAPLHNESFEYKGVKDGH